MSSHKNSVARAVVAGAKDGYYSTNSGTYSQQGYVSTSTMGRATPSYHHATTTSSARHTSGAYGGAGSYGATSGSYVTGGSSYHPHTGGSGYQKSIVTHTGSARKVSEVVKGEEFVLPANAYEQSRRQVSSVVIFEEQEQVPEKPVRYVEVPQYEEVVKHVPIKEVREVEKVVPKVVEEWVERIVEIPQVEEVVRHVEVPQVEEVIKHVPKVEIVDRPYEVVKHVPKIEIQKVEKVVEVAHDVIEVPKAVTIEERVPVISHDDTEAMLIVSQKVKPVIVDGAKEVLVDVVEYEPEVMPVDIHVAKFVEQELVMVGAKETIHRCVTVPAAQYNSMLRFLNVHLTDVEIQNLPYLQDSHGQVSFLPQDYQWHAPQEGLKIYGYRSGVIWGHGTPVKVYNASSMTEAEIRAKQAELDRQFQQIFQQFESERQRKIHSIETFNRTEETRVRNIIGGVSTTMTTTSASHSIVGGAMGTVSPSITFGQTSSKGSVAYEAGHAVGSAINRLTHH